MTTATLEKPQAKAIDGFGVRERGGIAYSLAPFAEAERPLYWNPIYPGQEMRWRDEKADERGLYPTIQKERWQDGQFRPRNAWEEAMTREWMIATLPGCNDPDRWMGLDHPKGADYQWRCECSWPCGNFDAFEAHQLYLKHLQSRSEKNPLVP